MALPKEIAALIETFAANEADYTAPEFKEAQVRQQFIDPLFAALGWDVANTSGYLKLLPIAKVSSAGQKKVADPVQSLISLHRAQAAAQTPHEKDALAKQITAADRQIDALVEGQ